ncbi:hypothetical protein CERSUDRAFT_86923 [Gelatoporia subvermispora B]|uniref:Uncharacterized protein n=1 Tax=Ceriporiopsis subvermispora (strain B) TaxID=914234 RepID=M2R5X7_CERS8|nr:hypothetical protein CERSUDRAFT_86923 [Gelatoporia subvermispora B]
MCPGHAVAAHAVHLTYFTAPTHRHPLIALHITSLARYHNTPHRASPTHHTVRPVTAYSPSSRLPSTPSGRLPPSADLPPDRRSRCHRPASGPQTLLHTSKHIPDAAAWREVHEALRLRHLRARPLAAGVDARIAQVRKLATEFLPSARVWAAVFAREAGEDADVDAEAAGAESSPVPEAAAAVVAAGEESRSRGGRGPSHSHPSSSSTGDAEADARVLALVYSYWRESPGAGSDAPLAYARWLLAHGRGKDATNTILRAQPALEASERLELERRWRAVIEGGEEQQPDEDDAEVGGDVDVDAGMDI